MGGLIVQLQQIQCPFCNVSIFRVAFSGGVKGVARI